MKCPSCLQKQLFGSLLRRLVCHSNLPNKENIAYSLGINEIDGVRNLTFNQLNATVALTDVAKTPSKQEGSK